jgi:hypothetical protein
LVSIGEEGEEHSTDVLRIARPDDLTDLAALGLTLAEGKRLVAGLQQEIVAAQAPIHAVRRPECHGYGDVCGVKDYRQHGIATLFGQVTVRLRRFCCAVCSITEAGVDWPPRVRSTHGLDQLRAQLSALIDISDGCRPAWADVPGGLDGNWWTGHPCWLQGNP